jgi:hypothetical protein
MRGHIEQRAGSISLEHTSVYPEDVGRPPPGLVDIRESHSRRPALSAGGLAGATHQGEASDVTIY